MTLLFWDGNRGPYQVIREFGETAPPPNSATLATLLLFSTSLILPFSFPILFTGGRRGSAIG